MPTFFPTLDTNALQPKADVWKNAGLVYDVTDTDIVGHKMAALKVEFSRLSNVDF